MSATTLRLSHLRSQVAARARQGQSGFTLIEILVALALITLLAVGISLSFDGSRSKAQALLNNMQELASANVRLKNDMGCYVTKPAGLLTAAGAGSNNGCGITGTPSSWNGPYIGVVALNGTDVEMNKVAQGVTITFTSTTVPVLATAANNPYVAGGSGTNYGVEADNVPADIVNQAVQECNGTSNLGNGLAGFKCDGVVTGTTGSFFVLYDQTR